MGGREEDGDAVLHSHGVPLLGALEEAVILMMIPHSSVNIWRLNIFLNEKMVVMEIRGTLESSGASSRHRPCYIRLHAAVDVDSRVLRNGHKDGLNLVDRFSHCSNIEMLSGFTIYLQVATTLVHSKII